MHCELTAEGKSGWRAEEQVTDALELKREPPRITNLAVSSRVARRLPKLQQFLPPECASVEPCGDSRWLPDGLATEGRERDSSGDAKWHLPQ